MLEIEVPGVEPLLLEHLVLDFNGTLACDGITFQGVIPLLVLLSSQLRIHVVTGDTFGSARTALKGLPCKLVILDAGCQAQAKFDYVKQLGVLQTVAIGNGRNDRLMLQAVALGIVVVQAEGASARTLAAADVVVGSILDALGLLLHPLRLTATLRG